MISFYRVKILINKQSDPLTLLRHNFVLIISEPESADDGIDPLWLEPLYASHLDTTEEMEQLQLEAMHSDSIPVPKLRQD